MTWKFEVFLVAMLGRWVRSCQLRGRLFILLLAAGQQSKREQRLCENWKCSGALKYANRSSVVILISA